MSNKYTEKSYRLTEDRSGEAFLLKTGKNRRLLTFDAEKGYNRAIRHCPNEKSIFIDEQSEHALVEPIIFYKGVLTVSATDQTTQRFLDAHPSNVANGGNWFEAINDDADATEEVEMEDLILDIKNMIREKAKEDSGIYALEMVVAVMIDSVEKASQMSEEALKRVLYNEADRNPYYFTDDNGNVNIFDNESMQRKYLTIRAIKDGVIKRSPNSKSILWTKDNTVIATAPKGLELIDYFADYLSSDEGMLVIEEIKRRS